VAKDVTAQVFPANVIIGSHHDGCMQAPPVDVRAQPFASLAETHIIVVGQHEATLVDTT
jgi:hypothetical protein